VLFFLSLGAFASGLQRILFFPLQTWLLFVVLERKLSILDDLDREIIGHKNRIGHKNNLSRMKERDALLGG
jgi:hypothetical protein